MLRNTYSFAEQVFVSWNPHRRSFAVGDTIYLFFSQDRAVRVKAEVVEVGVPIAVEDKSILQERGVVGKGRAGGFLCG